ncbi:hypothetical protein C8R47DRAFT_1189910 [Mycena vitilis]|nr:hypothetical protein C8R47DRAFT_1189910 [Mycena vitilis]
MLPTSLSRVLFLLPLLLTAAPDARRIGTAQAKNIVRPDSRSWLNALPSFSGRDRNRHASKPGSSIHKVTSWILLCVVYVDVVAESCKIMRNDLDKWLMTLGEQHKLRLRRWKGEAVESAPESGHYLCRASLEELLLAAHHAVGQTLTNGARMRAGLGPLKPRTLFSPTRVRGTRDTPSGTPVLPRTGAIEVREATSNQHLGFVSYTFTSDGYLAVTTGTNALNVSGDNTTPFTLKATTPRPLYEVFYPYLIFSANGPISEGGFAFLTADTNSSPPGDDGSRSNGETAVWSLTSDSQLIPTWIDVGQTTPTPVAIFWNLDANRVSLAKFGSTPFGYTHITLWLVQPPSAPSTPSTPTDPA